MMLGSYKHWAPLEPWASVTPARRFLPESRPTPVLIPAFQYIRLLQREQHEYLALAFIQRLEGFADQGAGAVNPGAPNVERL